MNGGYKCEYCGVEKIAKPIWSYDKWTWIKTLWPEADKNTAACPDCFVKIDNGELDANA